MAMTDEEFCVQSANDVLAYARSKEQPPYAQEVIDLAEGFLKVWGLQRWRKFPDEKPTESGVYHIYALDSRDYIGNEDDVARLYGADYWDSEKLEWSMGNEPAMYWRPIGQIPAELYLPDQPKQGSLFQ